MKFIPFFILAVTTIALSPVQTGSGLFRQVNFQEVQQEQSKSTLSELDAENPRRWNAWSFGSTLSLYTGMIGKRLSKGSNGHLSQLITVTESRLAGLLNFFGEDPTPLTSLALAENTLELMDGQIELMKKVHDDLIENDHEPSADIVALSLAAHNLEYLVNCGISTQVVAEFQDVVRYRASELGLPLPEIKAVLNPKTRDIDRLEYLALTSVPSYQLRDMAFELYKKGKYAQAKEPLMLMLQSGYEISSTRLHLARIALVTDDIPAVRKQLNLAWKHRRGAWPYVLPRILWMKLTISLLENGKDDRPKVKKILGQLKTALQTENSHMEWTMAPVLEHLRAKLPAEAHAFLTALVAELSDEANIGETNSLHI